MTGASPGGFVPAFAGYAERVRDSFARQGAMALIGASIVDVAAGYCSIALVPRPEVLDGQRRWAPSARSKAAAHGRS